MPRPRTARPFAGARPLSLAALLLLGASACLSPREPATPRWFHPALPAVTAAAAASDAPALRLRPVTASRQLGLQISWRSSDVEFGSYDQLRWTETPAAVMEAGLTGALFETGALRRTSRTKANTLSVTLRRFDQQLKPALSAQVELVVLLENDAGDALLDATYAGQSALSSDDPQELARALGQVSGKLLAEITQAVAAALSAQG